MLSFSDTEQRKNDEVLRPLELITVLSVVLQFLVKFSIPVGNKDYTSSRLKQFGKSSSKE